MIWQDLCNMVFMVPLQQVRSCTDRSINWSEAKALNPESLGGGGQGAGRWMFIPVLLKGLQSSGEMEPAQGSPLGPARFCVQRPAGTRLAGKGFPFQRCLRCPLLTDRERETPLGTATAQLCELGALPGSLLCFQNESRRTMTSNSFYQIKKNPKSTQNWSVKIPGQIMSYRNFSKSN